MQKPSAGHLEGLVNHHLEMVVRAKRPCLRPPREIQSLIPHQSELIHHCSPAFLEIYLPFWAKHGFLFYGTAGTVLDYDPCPSTDVCDLELLAMAQRVRFRLIRLMRYMAFTESIHAENFPKSQQTRAPAQNRIFSVTESSMRRIYADWDDVKSEVRCNRRGQYLKENRHAKRWLLATSKLSLGVLLVAGRRLESHLNDTRMSDSYLVAFLDGIASQYPDAIEVFQLLSGTVRSILARKSPIEGINMDQVVAGIRAVLGENNGEDELPSLHEPSKRVSSETKALSGVHNEHSTIQVLDGISPIPEDFLLAYDFSSP